MIILYSDKLGFKKSRLILLHANITTRCQVQLLQSFCNSKSFYGNSSHLYTFVSFLTCFESFANTFYFNSNLLARCRQIQDSIAWSVFLVSPLSLLFSKLGSISRYLMTKAEACDQNSQFLPFLFHCFLKHTNKGS